MSPREHHHREHHQVDGDFDPFEHFGSELAELKAMMARDFIPGEIERIVFDGKAGIVAVTDDHGSNALSYAVYNPNDFRVFVGLAGQAATADGLIIPKQKLVVAPLIVNGPIQLAADVAELAEKKGTIIRVRFPTPQPFFVGALT